MLVPSWSRVARAVALSILAVSAGMVRLAASGQSETARSQGPVEITVFFGYPEIPPENNLVILELAKRTGVLMKPLQVDPANYLAKLNAMVAAKTVPDMFAITPLQFEEFARNGIIVPLDDYLQKYGSNILKDKKDLLKNVVMDGKTWYIPTGYQFNPPMLAVRQDWLENVGLKVPTTLDEFYTVLKTFTRNDPNKDGKDNTIGLGASLIAGCGWRQVFPAFGISDLYGNYVDGKWTPYLLHPKYLDAVKFLRRLYSEGLMEPDFATMPNMQSFEKLWSGVYGAYDWTPTGTTNNWLGRYKETPTPRFSYAILKGPDGLGGVQAYRDVQPKTGGIAVSANCKRPADAVRFVD